MVAEIEARIQPAESSHPQEALPSEQPSFLTLDAKKVGFNIPSQANIVSLLDLHTPNSILLTETPLLLNNGALTHILRNRGYKIH